MPSPRGVENRPFLVNSLFHYHCHDLEQESHKPTSSRIVALCNTPHYPKLLETFGLAVFFTCWSGSLAISLEIIIGCRLNFRQNSYNW